MINVIIIDDDASCLRTLREILAAIVSPKIKILAECNSAGEAKQAISVCKPDIIFLDVEMPDKTGFDLLNELNDIHFDVVFVTAYDQYAIQAIKLSALDFLLKPVDGIEVAAAIDRFEKKRNREQMFRQIQLLLENYGLNNDSNKTLAVPTNNGLEFIRTAQITRLEAESSYTTFFLTGNTKLMVAKTLKEIEELLPKNLFFRVHSSHLVNVGFIKRFQKSDGGMLIMEDKSNIPVSRHRKDEFIQFLKGK